MEPYKIPFTENYHNLKSPSTRTFGRVLTYRYWPLFQLAVL